MQFILSVPFRLIAILLLFTLFCITWSCTQQSGDGHGGSGSGDPAGSSVDARAGAGPGVFPEAHPEFVGDLTCRTCHAGEWEEWRGSHHDMAMAEPDEETVRGDFSDVTFIDGEDEYRFYRQEGDYLVEAPGPDGESTPFRLVYTFGWEPLQQYLVDIGSGKLQALHIAWDTEREEWFSLYPDDQFEPDDWLHWTGGAMNWNTMCASCHSTDLKQNYIAETDSFHTTYSDINVSCEACHGPGGDHVATMEGSDPDQLSRQRIQQDLRLSKGATQAIEINTCAPCHSLRQELTGEYVHGDSFMDHYDPMLPHPPNYHADGQILEEVYVFSSFLQSRMFHEGVTCSDCHNPHSVELKATINDNKLCMQCHEPRYNTPEHHFHQVQTEASQCVNCHMPGRYYMEVDYRRDHSFRVPRPDQSVMFGTPNACNSCHEDRSAEWAAGAVEEWYGPDRADHFTDTFLQLDADPFDRDESFRSLIADTSQPEIIRATAIWYSGQFPDSESQNLIAEALNSNSPLIRSSAAKALENLISVSGTRPLLRAALDDPVKAVRISAVRSLAADGEGASAAGPASSTSGSMNSFSFDLRNHPERLREYRNYLQVNQYFPQGQMNLARFYELQGETDRAIEAYELTLERDPYFNPARMNLAYLLNESGRNARAEELLRTVVEQEPEFGQAYYSLALLLAEMDRLNEALNYFEQAAELLPEQHRILYNLAVAYQTLGHFEDSEQAYQRVVEAVPDNPDYRYGLITLYMQHRQPQRALEHAERLDQLAPGNLQIRQLIDSIRRELD